MPLACEAERTYETTISGFTACNNIALSKRGSREDVQDSSDEGLYLGNGICDRCAQDRLTLATLKIFHSHSCPARRCGSDYPSPDLVTDPIVQVPAPPCGRRVLVCDGLNTTMEQVVKLGNNPSLISPW